MKKRDKLRDLYKKCSKKIYISIITSLALFAPANPVFAAGDLTANTAHMSGLNNLGMLIASIVYGVLTIAAAPLFAIKLVLFLFTGFSVGEQERARNTENFKKACI